MSDRLLRAINVAAWAHDGQLRKGTDIPYISHVFAVMHLVSQQPGIDEDTRVAALFHDILEDAAERYSAQMMARDFGPEVVRIVQQLTKDSGLSSWQSRADAYLATLEKAPRPVLIIAACDKVHNLSSIVADYRAIGEQLWTRFNAGEDSQRWWYRAVYETVCRRFEELGAAKPPILDDYRALLEQFDAMGKNADSESAEA